MCRAEQPSQNDTLVVSSPQDMRSLAGQIITRMHTESSLQERLSPALEGFFDSVYPITGVAAMAVVWQESSGQPGLNFYLLWSTLDFDDEAQMSQMRRIEANHSDFSRGVGPRLDSFIAHVNPLMYPSPKDLLKYLSRQYGHQNILAVAQLSR